MRYILSLFVIISLFLSACNTPPPSTETENTVPDSLARVPSSWIEDRVTQAHERLNASQAGTLVWQSTEAHGGLNRWFSNGPLAFQFNYQPLDGGTPRNTYEVADYWSARTRHQAMDTTAEYGWTGQSAWVTPPSMEMPYNTRFWSLTPYYFVGIPFVLADEGTYHEYLGEETYRDRTYDAVKITFGENIGDAPDDYYVVYIDKETKLVGVTRYIVSYPGYFPDGGHLPEKFMDWTGHQTIDGITIAQGFDTYWWKDDQPAEHITDIEVTRAEFKPDVTDAYFDAPENASMITDL
ncbi:MAG: DUF6503 family protein [Bacteroidota bacterium]